MRTGHIDEPDAASVNIEEEEDEEECADEKEELKREDENFAWHDLLDLGWTAKPAGKAFLSDTWHFFRPGVTKVCLLNIKF